MVPMALPECFITLSSLARLLAKPILSLPTPWNGCRKRPSSSKHLPLSKILKLAFGFCGAVPDMLALCTACAALLPWLNGLLWLSLTHGYVGVLQASLGFIWMLASGDRQPEVLVMLGLRFGQPRLMRRVPTLHRLGAVPTAVGS